MKKILLAGDENQTRHELHVRLENLGYVVAENILLESTVLSLLKELAPDVVIMPMAREFDAVKLALMIKKEVNIPIVFCLEKSDESIFQNLQLFEPYGYITPPFKNAEIKSVIEMTLLRNEYELLRKAFEIQNQSVLNSTRVAFIVIDDRNYIVDINSANQNDFFNVTLNRPLSETFDPELQEIILKQIRLLRESGRSEVIEFDSLVNHTINHFSAHFALKGLQNSVLMMVHNLTATNFVRPAMVESGIRYSRVVDNMRDGLIVDDVSGRIKYANSKFCKLFGFELNEAIQLKLEDYVAPEYREQLRKMHSDRIAGKTTDSYFEFVGLRKDGTRFWADASVTAIEENFEIIGTQSTIRDITERKMFESKFRTAFHVLEQTTDQVMITNTAGIIQYVNASLIQCTGFSSEEFIGQTPRICKSDRHPRLFYELLWETISTGQIFKAVFTNRRRNGDIYYEEKTISPVRNEDGAITHYVSIGRDVTERLQIGRTLMRRRELLTAIQEISLIANNEDNLDKILQMSVERMCRILSWPVGHVFEFREETKTFCSTGIWKSHMPEEYNEFKKVTSNTTFEVGEGIIGKVAEQKKTLWISDILQNKLFQRKVYPIRAMLVVPIISESKVPLVIEFFSPNPADPDEATITAMDSIQSQIGRIIERQKSNHELLKRATLFGQLFDTAPAGICLTSSDAEVIRINDRFKTMFGIDESNCIGKPIDSLIVPPTKIKEAKALTRIAMKGRSVFKETQRLRSDETLLNVLLYTVPVVLDNKTLGAFAMYVDVTDERKKAQELAESENRYRDVVENTREAILIVSGNKIIFSNRAGIRLLGINPDNIAQSIFRNFLHTDSLEKYDRGISNLSEGMPTITTLHLVTEYSNQIEVEVSFNKINHQGIQAVQLILRDVTLLSQLRKKTQRLEHLAALGQFSATVAHEIRNPLASISLNVEHLLRRFEVPTNVLPIFDGIKLGINRIKDIIKGILDYVRPIVPHFNPADIHVLLDRCVQSIEPDVRNRMLTIRKNYLAKATTVLIDENQIIQVFVNLMINAVNASKNGAEIILQTESTNNTLEVSVIDFGCGIASENISKLFEPFFTTRAEGIGLGLPIVAKILDEHKARISVTSELNKGSTFRVSFETEN